MVGSCLCLPFACVRRPRRGGIRASQPARPWFPPWPWLAPPTRRRTVPNGAFLCAMLAPERGMRYCSLFKKQRAPPHSMILCFDSSRAGNADIKRRRRCTASTARACNLGGSHHAFRPTVALCADGPCYQKAAALPIHTYGVETHVRTCIGPKIWPVYRPSSIRTITSSPHRMRAQWMTMGSRESIVYL